MLDTDHTQILLSVSPIPMPMYAICHRSLRRLARGRPIRRWIGVAWVFSPMVLVCVIMWTLHAAWNSIYMAVWILGMTLVSAGIAVAGVYMLFHGYASNMVFLLPFFGPLLGSIFLSAIAFGAIYKNDPFAVVALIWVYNWMCVLMTMLFAWSMNRQTAAAVAAVIAPI